MAMTRCPKCGKPAVLVDARPVGETYVPEMEAWVPVVERRISCPAPAGCGTEGKVHVSHRIELYRGEDSKRRVPWAQPPKRRRSCGRDVPVDPNATRNSVGKR